MSPTKFVLKRFNCIGGRGVAGGSNCKTFILYVHTYVRMYCIYSMYSVRYSIIRNVYSETSLI